MGFFVVTNKIVGGKGLESDMFVNKYFAEHTAINLHLLTPLERIHFLIISCW